VSLEVPSQQREDSFRCSLTEDQARSATSPFPHDTNGTKMARMNTILAMESPGTKCILLFTGAESQAVVGMETNIMAVLVSNSFPHGWNLTSQMHRHRLVALANPVHFNVNVTLTGASKSGRLVRTIEPGSMAQALTNITFCEITMCEMFGCDLPTIFPFGPRKSFGEAWKNKLVIDSDGWGPSGRWRALVASQSVAIRSSVYREWFVQRMVPWVHYVPASVGLGDLWGILGYFLGTADGGVSFMPRDGNVKTKWSRFLMITRQGRLQNREQSG